MIFSLNNKAKTTGYMWLSIRVSYNGTMLIDNVIRVEYNASKKNPAEAVKDVDRQIRRNARRMIKGGYQPERLIVSIKRLRNSK